MHETRDEILSALRRRLGREGRDARATGVLEASLEHPESNLIPERAKVSGEACARLFDEMVGVSLAGISHVATMQSLPRAAAEYLDANQLPRELVISPDRRLADLDWESAGIAAHARNVRDGDRVALGLAFCGIAETGTLMFVSGEEHGTLSSFLPDHHLAVVARTDLVGSYEQAWSKLRARGAMPRSVNWVTGPSRSADIELTMLMGAHGPLALHVLVVDDDA